MKQRGLYILMLLITLSIILTPTYAANSIDISPVTPLFAIHEPITVTQGDNARINVKLADPWYVMVHRSKEMIGIGGETLRLKLTDKNNNVIYLPDPENILEAITDSTGVAKFKINTFKLKPGNYNIIIEYAGNWFNRDMDPDNTISHDLLPKFTEAKFNTTLTVNSYI